MNNPQPWIELASFCRADVRVGRRRNRPISSGRWGGFVAVRRSGLPIELRLGGTLPRKEEPGTYGEERAREENKRAEGVRPG